MSRNGHHAFTFDDSGNTYTGAWRDGKKHGHGRYTWANGDRYTGAHCDDKRHGHDTFTWACGRSYEGTWHESAPIRARILDRRNGGHAAR